MEADDEIVQAILYLRDVQRSILLGRQWEKLIWIYHKGRWLII